jgi:hypothetical protein
MNTPALTEDENDDANLGLYQRATQTGAEWWRVSVADRPETYRLEHGVDDADGAGAVDIDLVVDAENLRAKLKKWRREGFAIDAGDTASAPSALERKAFMPELQRVAALGGARPPGASLMKTLARPCASVRSRCAAAPAARSCRASIPLICSRRALTTSSKTSSRIAA